VFKKVVIIGAGPTGLGAAYRLQELGYNNWEICESNSYIGGLASSFEDDKGFTWDIGGHLLFSHYDYVHKLVAKLLGDEYLLHQRDSWIWVLNHWVPYPFQNNIRYLPKDKVLECLLGLIEIQGQNDDSKNFQEWILNTFGEGIAKYFMLPHNRKLWAHPLESMDKNWIAERVSVVNIEKVLKNVLYELDDVDWGPNSQFKFPLYGGTGGLFNRFMPYIQDHLSLGQEMTAANVETKVVKFSSGREAGYDVLINTTPLDQFIFKMTPKVDFLIEAAKLLKHNGIFSIGIAVRKPCPSKKCSLYFPESNYCFHRATYFSNYSPNNVPDAKRYYSLMCEIPYSEHRPEDRGKIVAETIEGLVKANLISEGDKDLIDTVHVIQADYAYPIPTLERDKALNTIQPYLEGKGIYSRGRFGAWKYEVGNMDHSIMQGVEAVDRILEHKEGKNVEVDD